MKYCSTDIIVLHNLLQQGTQDQTCVFCIRAMARLNGFYQTTAWTRCRNAYFDSVGGLCERCKAKGIINAGRVVHHKTFLTEKNGNDPAIAFGFDNLILLCQACHEEVHRGVKRYTFDAEGNIISKGLN